MIQRSYSTLAMLVAVAFAQAGCALPAEASGECTLYVRAGFVPAEGAESADGKSPESAFASIAVAARHLENFGEIVCVGPGLYLEGDITPNRSGIGEAPIVFRADPSGTTTGDPPSIVRLAPPKRLPFEKPPQAGFRLLGHNDIVIEGFTIEMFSDAGIQVRSAAGKPKNSTDITLRNNVLLRNGKLGVDINAEGLIVVEGNTAIGNGTSGISIRSCVGARKPGDDDPSPRCRAGPSGPVTPRVSNNRIGINGAHGLYIEGASSGLVQDNIVFSNGATGITLRTAPDFLLFNNLVYRNGEEGLAVGSADSAAEDAVIANNTFYDNERWGVVIGSSNASSPGAIVVNNIFELNGNGTQGIGVLNEGSLSIRSTCRYIAGFNLNPDGYGPKTPSNIYDSPAEPLFLDPAGPDGVLGGEIRGGRPVDYSRDDNFRLPQDPDGPNGQSPAVDAGSTTAAELRVTGSTAEDGRADTGVIDIGYHYGAAPSEPPAIPTPFMPVYVRADGSDGNGGRAPDDAFASIATAASLGRAGVTVLVGPGRYPECDLHPPPDMGKSTFLADARSEVLGEAPGVVLVDAGCCRTDSGECQAGTTGFSISNSCSVVIDGFHIRGASEDGLQIESGSHWAEVSNNVVFSNMLRGIQVVNANDVRVINNLTYNNGSVDGEEPARGGGIQIGGKCPETDCEEGGSRRAVVQGNTCYANSVNGILIGAGLGVSSHATVRYNIMQANGRNGIQVGSNTTWELHLAGYHAAYNVNVGGEYGAGTPQPDTDRVDDPLFIDPSGPDGELAGDGFVDDDFHLRQVAAGEMEDSPAVDMVGKVSAAHAGMGGRTTRSDGAPDSGSLDVGFHYPAERPDVLYVSPDGSDTNSGLIGERPLLTIEEALRRAEAGSRVELAAGTYPASSLRPGEGVTIVGADSQRSLVDAAGGSTAFDIREADVSILRVGITGARSAGVRVRADRFVLLDCRIYGNPGKGVFVPEGAGSVILNNLIYGNENTAIVIGQDGWGAQNLTIAHNTIYGNRNRGIAIGLGARVPSAGVYIVNNIMAENTRAGIEIGNGDGVRPCYNCNSDGYVGMPRPATDIVNAPRVVDGEGNEVELVDGGASDDAFYLAQVAAGQRVTSPCVDGGWQQASELGLDRSSTRTDGMWDRARADVGYHAGVAGLSVSAVVDFLRLSSPNGDCDGDGVLTVNELVLIVRIALGVAPLDGCRGADRDGNGRVSIEELVQAVTLALTQG